MNLLFLLRLQLLLLVLLLLLGMYSSSARAFVISEASLGKGGAFYVSGAKLSINTDKNTKMTGNKANYGGVFYLENVGELEINSSMTIQNNSASYGGAFYFSNDSKAAFKAPMIIQNNSATYGGVLTGLGDYTISGSGEVTCSGNNATDGNGGDFAYISGGTINFGGNFSSSGGKGTNGGAMYISGANVTFNGELTLENNEASSVGGGMYIASSNITFNNKMTIQNNLARNGGGVMFYISTITFLDTFILKNNILIVSKVPDGVALYSSSSTIKFINNSTTIITGNRALGTYAVGGGGGIFFYNSLLWIEENPYIEISNNYSAKYGGGIYFSRENGTSNRFAINSNFRFKNSSGNTAPYKNGGYWLDCSGVYWQ